MKFLHVLCCLMVFSASFFGQNLQADLKKHFNRFSVVKINSQEALLKAKSGVAFKIQTNEITFEFVLAENDMRSADYKSEYTDRDGRKPEPRYNTVTTYKGKLTGQSGSIVRMFLDGLRIEGFISTQDRQDYFIEPAANYSSWASSDEVVIFQAKDKVNKPLINLDMDGLVAQVKSGVDKQAQAQFVKAGFTRFAGVAQTAMRSIRVATDADDGFVRANGGVSYHRNKITGALNIVDGIYERDLNLSITHGYHHFWKAYDPYGDLRGDALLAAFKDYWNPNYPQTSYPRNVAHLFSDNYDAPYYGGRGYIGEICKNPSLAYSVTFLYNTGDASDYALVVAHEIGHNLGGTHTSEASGQIRPGCENSLMQYQLYLGTNGFFCEYSKTEITNYYRPLYDPNQLEGLLCDPTLTQP